MSRIGMELQDYFLPFLDDEPEQFESGEKSVPAMAYINMSVEPRRIRIIAQPKDPAQIKPLMKAIQDKYREYPAMRGFVTRGSIITSNSGGTRSVNLDISGPNLEDIYDAALAAYRRAEEVFESPRLRADPSTLSLSQPMIEVRPDWSRASELGMSTQDIGYAVTALTDGAFADEFYLDDDKIDIYLYNKQGRAPHSTPSIRSRFIRQWVRSFPCPRRQYRGDRGHQHHPSPERPAHSHP
jgi:multidrug efflux pump subunit AcrB